MFTTLTRVVKKSPIESAIILLVIFAVGYGAVPKEVFANQGIGPDMAYVSLQVEKIQNNTLKHGVLPRADLRGPAYTMTVPATAYNSLEAQTDSTPFITASGTRTRHGVVAANFLPIGTRIKIPEIYGDQVFIVEDRMNPRYWHKVDIWMEHYDDAIQFGHKNIKIEVYPTS